jgi:hypothetical protein
MGTGWVGAGVVAGIRTLAGETLTVLGLILGIVGWGVITKDSKFPFKEGRNWVRKTLFRHSRKEIL